LLPIVYPEAKLYLIIGRGRKELYYGLKRYILFETNEKVKISKILKKYYEIVFDLNAGDKHVINFFRGIVLQYHLYIGFKKTIVIRNEIQISSNNGIPRWKDYLNFLPESNTSISWDGSYRLTTSKASKNLCRLLFSFKTSYPIICIAPGSSKFEKRWPSNYYAEVISFLKGTIPCNIVLLGDNFEILLGEEITNLLNFQIHNLIGISPIGCAMEIISKCAFVLANDSGLFHISSLLNTPALGIYGPTNSEKWSLLRLNCYKIQSQTGNIKDILPSQVIEKCLTIFKHEKIIS
jgi:ADP-heptose:LPS heptosyltransferase